MRRRQRTLLALLPLTALLMALPARAASSDIAVHGGGFRIGVADNPDQFLAGFQLNLGEFVPHLRFQPNLEIGLGDDAPLVEVTAPVHYRVLINRDFTLYGGGGVSVAWIHYQRGGRGNDFVIAPTLVGGLEWPYGASHLFTELSASGGALHDAKLMFGWNF
jgi:hypothetical protein